MSVPWGRLGSSRVKSHKSERVGLPEVGVASAPVPGPRLSGTTLLAYWDCLRARPLGPALGHADYKSSNSIFIIPAIPNL
jgi:hypothetical protein